MPGPSSSSLHCFVADNDASYDADDAPTATSASVAGPSISVVSDPASTKPEPSNYGEEPDTTYVPPPFETADAPQINGLKHEERDRAWRHERSHDGDDVHMSTEPFGSGIKEDG